METTLIYLLIFIIGLLFGSFANSLIYRLENKKPILIARSQCPHCYHRLGFWDLFPILSFIFLAGHCRYCGKRISWQYPLVELAMASLFVLSFYFYGLSLASVFIGLDIFFLVAIFTYDFRYQLIPDQLSFPAMILALIGGLWVLEIGWLKLLLGGIIGLSFFLSQLLISRGKWIGGGDLRLGLLLGLLLGWEKLIIALVVGYIFGSLVGLFLIITGQKEWRSKIALAPFLITGALITLFWGQELINWFLNWFQ